MFDTKLTVTQP